MRLLVVHNRYRKRGGEDTSVEGEVELFEAYGHDVCLFERDNVRIDESGFLAKLALGATTVWSREAYADLTSLLVDERPDVAHFHNTLPLISPSAYYACRDQGVPVVQTLNNFRLICPGSRLVRDDVICELCVGKAVAWPGVVHGCYRNSVAASGTIAAMLALHRLLGTWRDVVDRFIAVTEFNRVKFLEGGLPAAKLSVAPSFVYPDPGRGPGGGRYAVFVGRLARQKGVEVLLRAWQALTVEIPLKLVGDGEMAPAVQAAVERNPLVEWLGFLSHHDALEIIGEAEFLVLPSIDFENFPFTIIEAFAKGVPVLTTDHGSLAEIVDDGRTGRRFRPGDPADLADKAEQLWKDREARTAMGDAARSEYERLYTGEHYYAELMRIFREVTGGC
jgi:glycosyltransferase involved in cell wall biosynthesis